MTKTVGMVSLGCDKNRVDSEHILYNLTEAGYRVVQDASAADYILINTCAFIESAKKESIDTILEFAGAKQNPRQKIVVLGCLASRYRAVLEKEMPEADIIAGIETYDKLVEILENETRVPVGAAGYPAYEAGRVITTPYHYAYLKIADGCDNFCSYCAIPFIRGRYRSYPKERLLAEAAGLADEGVKELVLVAQDITRYGKDLYGYYALKDLIQALLNLPFEQIRLLYVYPELLDDELIQMVATEPRIAKYLDIPMQHIDDDVLKRMNRRTTGGEQRALIKKIKTANADIAIRSSFIVGFPGETEEAFAALQAFIGAGNIDYAGFFPYSKEENTRAAAMPAQIPAKVKKARAASLSRLQSAVIEEKHAAYLGKTLAVRYEGIDYAKQRFYGRTDRNAPEVDTKVFFTASVPLTVGNRYWVRITKTGFHLTGEVVGEIEEMC